MRLRSLSPRVALRVLFGLSLAVLSCNTDHPLAPQAPKAPNFAIGIDPETGAWIETDRDDYVPGDTVRIIGGAWQPGETVTLHLSEQPNTHPDTTWDIVADSAGNVAESWYLVVTADLGVVFELTATGFTSGSIATAVFTDDRDIDDVEILDPATATFVELDGTAPPFVVVSQGATISVRVIGDADGDLGTPEDDWHSTRWEIWNAANSGSALATGCNSDVNITAGASNFAHEFTFTNAILSAAGTYSLRFLTFSANGCVTQSGDGSDGVSSHTGALRVTPITAVELQDPATLSYVLLDGSAPPSVTAFIGATMTLRVTANVPGGTDNEWHSTEVQVRNQANSSNVGSAVCDNGIGLTSGSGQDEVVFTAPSDPGIYSLRIRVADDDGCSTSAPNPRGESTQLAVLVVVDPAMITKVELQDPTTSNFIEIDAAGPPTITISSGSSITARITGNSGGSDDDWESTRWRILDEDGDELATDCNSDINVTAAGTGHVHQFTFSDSELDNPGTYGLIFEMYDDNSCGGQRDETEHDEVVIVIDPTEITKVELKDPATNTFVQIDDVAPPSVTIAVGTTLTVRITANVGGADPQWESTNWAVRNAANSSTLTNGCVDVDILTEATGAEHEFTITSTTFNTAGTYSLRFRIFDDDGCSDQRDESLHTAVVIVVANSAPNLTGVPSSPQSIPELALYTFDANATDAQSPPQTLTFSLVGAPTGAAINPSTGVFTWTPTELQGPNGFTFTVRVSDGSVNTDQSLTLNVSEVNAAPSLLNVPASATIPELGAYSFDANATDSDVPVQTLTFSLSGHPAGATIHPTTGDFNWTPTEAQGPNSYTFDVRVGDGVTTTTQSVTLVVTEVNAAPSLLNVPASATIPELGAYSFDANAADGDAPAQTLNFSLLGHPAGATINPTTGDFDWTPTEAQGPDVYTFDVRVSDGITMTTQSITLTVTEVNAAPSLLNVPASATIPELGAYSFDANASDSDVPAQTLIFSLSGHPSGATINPSSGDFDWTPTEAQGPDVYTFDVRVSDGVTMTTQSVTLTVTEVNAAPSLLNVPASATIPELGAYSFDANASDGDVPVQTLTFSLSGHPSGATIHPSTGDFDWTPTEAQGPDVYTFDVRVSDGVTMTTQSVALTVTEVNAAPSLLNVPASATIPELGAYSFDANASDSDIPVQTLNFSLLGHPSGATIDPTTGDFDWTPTEAQGPDSYTFDVRVSDGVTMTTQSITLTVTEVNAAPSLLNVPASQTINELAAFTFDANSSDSDIPVQTLIFSLVGAPSGASINPSSGAFTWTPTEAQGNGGAYPFTVRLSDGVTNTDQALTLTVAEVNSNPTLTVPASFGIQWNVALSGIAASANDSDDPANTLTFSLVTAPDGMTINTSTGAISWTPDVGDIGPNIVRVRVVDNGSPQGSDEEQFTITVGARTTSLTYNGHTSGQYSDKAWLSATLVDIGTGSPPWGVPIEDQTISFTFNGGSAGSDATDATGQARLLYQVLNAASPPTYPVIATFTAANGYATSTATTANFTANKEDATVAFASENPGAVLMNTPFSLTITVKETNAEPTPNPDPDSRAAGGNILLAGLSVGLNGVATNGNVSPTSCTPSGTNTPYSTRTFVCLFPAIATVDAYVITASATGYYYTGSSEDALTVYDPAAGSLNGGGKFLIGTDRVSFGVNFTYGKGKTVPRGGLVVIRHYPDGSRCRVKSNSMDAPAIVGSTASFSGKGNYTCVNAAGTTTDSRGNLSITGYVEDNATPGQDADKFWIRAYGELLMSNSPSTAYNAKTLTGGNIQVPQPPR